MSVLAGRGNGGTRQTLIRFFFPLAVAFLLTVGVVAIPEEQNAAVHEQSQQQVAVDYLVFLKSVYHRRYNCSNSECSVAPTS